MIDFHYKRNFQDLTEMLSLPIAFHFSIHFFHVNSQNPHALFTAAVLFR